LAQADVVQAFKSPYEILEIKLTGNERIQDFIAEELQTMWNTRFTFPHKFKVMLKRLTQ
jgi:uncharacterized Zn finger protein